MKVFPSSHTANGKYLHKMTNGDTFTKWSDYGFAKWIKLSVCVCVFSCFSLYFVFFFFSLYIYLCLSISIDVTFIYGRKLQKPPGSHTKWFRTTNISIDNLFIWRRNFNAISEETAQLNKIENIGRGCEAQWADARCETGHTQTEYMETECVINLIFMFFMHAIPMPWICMHSHTHMAELDAFAQFGVLTLPAYEYSLTFCS